MLGTVHFSIPRPPAIYPSSLPPASTTNASIAPQLSSFWRVLSRRARAFLGLRPALSASRALGEHAELLAQRHLASLGFTPISRNAITRAGEADLLMRCPQGELVIIEVKSRVLAPGASAPPEHAIDNAKLARLRRIAALLARKNPRELIRVDALAIDLDAAHNAVAFRHYPALLRAR
jgi:putative endonuclease